MVNIKTISIISLSIMAYILGRSFIDEYNYTTACLLSIVNLIILLGYIYITDKHKHEKINIKAIIGGIFYTVSLILYLESMNNNNKTLSIKNQNVLLFIFGVVLLLILLGHNITKGEAFGAFITMIGLVTIVKYSN
jgi:hypothetical protein